MLSLNAKKTRVITHLNQMFKKKRYSSLESGWNTNEVASSSINKGYLHGKQIERIIFYLRSTGCAWSNTEYGGCLMCGHYHGTTKGEKIPKGAFSRQFAKEFNKYCYSKYPMVCIYNAGSILNNDEMHSCDLEKILVQIDSNENIKHVIIESRPEYITFETVSKVKSLLPNTVLEIGIGLETCSEIIRDLCINKGFTFEDYRLAAEIVRSAGVTLLTYLTVKPLFISSDEAVSDVLESISKIQMMTDVISLEPTSVQVGTLVEYFYINGNYNMPNGWLIQQIIKSVYKNTKYLPFELRIGGFEFFPKPEQIVSNCSKCDPQLYNAINIFNTAKDYSMIEALECNCKNEHRIKSEEEERSFNGRSMETRIASIIASILMRDVTTDSMDVR